MVTLILEVYKHLFKYCILLEIDFQRHVFGYLITRVFECVLYRVSRGIHETVILVSVTQMRPHNWLISSYVINESENEHSNTSSDKRCRNKYKFIAR